MSLLFFLVALGVAAPPEVSKPMPMPEQGKPAVARYFPDGAKPLLATLAAKNDAASYAAAARLYAPSDAAGMALLYALHALAFSSDEALRTELAKLFVDVLKQKIVRTKTDKGVDTSVSLAPGDMQVFALSQDATVAPLCHRFEVASLYGIPTDDAPWTAASVVAFASSLVTSDTARKAVDLELWRWLERLAGAKLLDVWLTRALGPAFPDTYPAWLAANGARLEQLTPWLAAHPFQPKWAPMPDELAPFP